MTRLDRIEAAHAAVFDDDETSWLVEHAAVPGLIVIARAVDAALAGYDVDGYFTDADRTALLQARAEFEAGQ